MRTIRDDGKIDGCDLGIMSVAGQISVRFADTTLLTAAEAGTAVRLTLGWTISTSRALTVDLPEVYLPRARRPISGPKGIEARYAFQAARPASGAFCTVTLKNDVASYP